MLDVGIQLTDHTVQILVRQQTEHRQAFAKRRTSSQTPGQILRRVRVMANIQQQVQALAVPLERATIQTTDHASRSQSRNNLLSIPRQTQQQISLQRQRGVFHRQIEQRQIPQLDDLTASLVDATLAAGQGVATLNLNVSFLRPAQVGTLQGEARLLRRGRDVCHVMGTLLQDGKEVATAVAVCKIVAAA